MYKKRIQNLKIDNRASGIKCNLIKCNIATRWKSYQKIYTIYIKYIKYKLRNLINFAQFIKIDIQKNLLMICGTIFISL